MKTTQTLLLAVTLSAGLLAATGANASLTLSADGKTVWDADLGITWLANANLAASNSFGLTYGYNYGSDIYPSVINSDGRMTWNGARQWIAAMNAANYLGYHDWRLPTTLQPDASCGGQGGSGPYGYNCIGSEMGHLFYSELGQVAGQSISSSTDPDKAKFTNLQNGYYWSGTWYTPSSDDDPWNFIMNDGAAWYFTTNGEQAYNTVRYDFYALAVRSGQVVATPVPAAAWLLGSGLLGLMGVARRRLVL